MCFQNNQQAELQCILPIVKDKTLADKQKEFAQMAGLGVEGNGDGFQR